MATNLNDSNLLPVKLTDEEREQLKSLPGLSEFQREKLEKDAKKNWDLFYKRNGDRFFKDRHWTKREFQELLDDTHMDDASSDNLIDKSRNLLEIGCGCGNFALPLLENSCCDTKTSNDLFIYCCDISDKAIEILKSNPVFRKYHPSRIKAFVADITENWQNNQLPREIDGQQMDIVSLIFVISALDPNKMNIAIENISKLLKPGGLVLFRDYAIYDKAMLRFSHKSKISDQFYSRQDGTRAYFFSKEQLRELFEKYGFQCQSIDYVHLETKNFTTKDKFSRIFLQAKFTR